VIWLSTLLSMKHVAKLISYVEKLSSTFVLFLFTIGNFDEESFLKSNFSLRIHIRNYKHKYLINQLAR